MLHAKSYLLILAAFFLFQFSFFTATAQVTGPGTVSITDKTVDPQHPLSGQPFTFTIAYNWSGFPNGTGPDIIRIQDLVPSPLIVTSVYVYSNGGANYGTSTGPGGRLVNFYIRKDLTDPSGTGTVQINCIFPFDSTCNGLNVCNREVQIGDSLNGVWSGWSLMSQSIKACVTDSAANNWSIKKDKLWCAYDAAGDSIQYRISICNNRTNSYSQYGSLLLNSIKLSDIVPAGAIISPTSVTGNWTGWNGTNFTGGPNTIYPSQDCYYVYFWVKYPNPPFTVGQTITNTARLDYTDPCIPGSKNFLIDSIRTDICGIVNTGAIGKSFTLNLYTPANVNYLPTVAPLCCGAYLIHYQNQGTIAQPNPVISDFIPPEVDMSGSITLSVPAPFTGVTVSYSTNGTTWNAPVGTYTNATVVTVPIGSRGIQLSYVGGSLPIGGVLNLNFSICFRQIRFVTSGIGTPVLPGNVITNIATISSGTYTGTATKTVTVDPNSPRFIAKKFFLGACPISYGPWEDGNTIRYRIAVANTGSAPANNCTITDALPIGLSLAAVPNVKYTVYNTFSYPGVNLYTPNCTAVTSTTPPYPMSNTSPTQTGSAGTGYTLTWGNFTFPNDCSGNISWLIIDFDVVIDSSMPACSYPNTYTISGTNPSTSLPVTTVSTVAWLTINVNSQTKAKKLVSTSSSGPFTASASIPVGGTGYYKLRIKNTGNTPVSNLSILDILPHPTNDIHILPPYTPGRGSAFDIVLTGTAPSVLIPPSFVPSTVQFSTATNPSRTGAFGGIGFCNIANPAGTSGTFGSGPITGSSSFQLVAPSGVKLLPGAVLEVIVPFTVNPNAHPDSQACNTFAYRLNGGGMCAAVGPCMYTESAPVCITATLTPNTGCCDTASFIPYAHADVNEDARTVLIWNIKQTPIAWIGIEYYKNCGTIPSSTSMQYPVSLNLGGLKAVWHGFATPFTYPVTWFNILNKHRGPNGVNSMCTAPSSCPGSLYQDKIMFNIGASVFDPDVWCIKLVVHHCDSSICTIDLPTFDPDTAVTSNMGVNVTPGTGTVRWLTMTLDARQFKGEHVRYILLTPQDSLDKIAGGSGGMFESADDLDSKAAVTSFTQSTHSALFGLRPDSLNGSLNIFITTQDPKSKPKIIWTIYNEAGKPLSKGLVEASSTVSMVNPPVANPGSSEVFITNIVPNPGSSIMTFTYSLGASEDARLELLNTLGQSVTVLADGFQSQGMHELNYNVFNLSEGTYFLRLSTRSGTASAVVKVIH